MHVRKTGLEVKDTALYFSPKRKKPPTTYTLADKRSFKDITIT